MATYTDTDYSEPKSSAEIQREIEMQRSRVENTIDQIQERLSPGQLVDELLSYTKHGGAEFAASLGRNAAANPLPVALLGISLAWLVAGPAKTPSVSGLFSRRENHDRSRPARRYSAYATAYDDDYDMDDRLDEFDDTLADAFDDELEHAYAPIQGTSLRRSSSGTDEASGSRYTEFVDDAGKKFRAATDAVGNRAGHFKDEAGNTFRGFTDATGNRIRQFRDEAGDVISDAAGWASEKWDQGRRALHDVRDAVSQGASRVSDGVSSAGRTMSQAGRRASRAGVYAGRQVSDAGSYAGRRAYRAGSAVGRQGAEAARRTADALQDQPLVTGALAFAVGAAIGALLPHTRKEDELMGETADSVRAEAGRKAGELYDSGKEQVASLYGQATDKAGELYQKATERAGEAYEQARGTVAAKAENLKGAASAAASELSPVPKDPSERSDPEPTAGENAFDQTPGAGRRELARDI